MPKITHRLLLFIITITIGCTAFADDSTTNTDQKLAQPVSIEAPYARLHAVLDELTRKSGVTIHCGKNKKDWQVRDIPVIVCAKDVPLGKLLKAIAESTHLLFSSETIGDHKVYRIWRDRKRELEMTSYEDKQHTAAVAIGKWEWDLAQKFQHTPATAFELPADYTWLRKAMQDPMARETSKIISLLGTDVRDKVLAGEQVKLNVRDASPQLKTALTSFLKASWTSAYTNNAPQSSSWTSPETEDYDKSSVIIGSASNNNEHMPIYINSIGPIPFNGYSLSTLTSLMSYAKKIDLPKRPDVPEPPNAKSTEDKSEVWQAKLDLEAPKGRDYALFGEALSAASEATGYAVVCEDFRSHQSNFNSKDIFKAGTTVRNVLFSRSFVSWNIDDDTKIISGSERNWVGLHRSLIPEAILIKLKVKLDSTGVELDDACCLANYSNQAIQEWIATSRDLNVLGMPFSTQDKQLWAFYDSLSPSDKARVLSDEGLPLADFDPNWFSQQFADRNKRTQPVYINSDYALTQYGELSTDLNAIATMSIRIKNAPISFADASIHIPQMEIMYRINGNISRTLIGSPGLSFPKYSAKRKAELETLARPGGVSK